MARVGWVRRRPRSATSSQLRRRRNGHEREILGEPDARLDVLVERSVQEVGNILPVRIQNPSVDLLALQLQLDPRFVGVDRGRNGDGNTAADQGSPDRNVVGCLYLSADEGVPANRADEAGRV